MTFIANYMPIYRTRANKVCSSCTFISNAKESCIREKAVKDALIDSFGEAWRRIMFPRFTKVVRVFRTNESSGIIPSFVFVGKCLVLLHFSVIIIVLVQYHIGQWRSIFPLFFLLQLHHPIIWEVRSTCLGHLHQLCVSNGFIFHFSIISCTMSCIQKDSMFNPEVHLQVKHCIHRKTNWVVHVTSKNTNSFLSEGGQLYVYLPSSEHMDLYESVSMWTKCFLSWAILISLLSLSKMSGAGRQQGNLEAGTWLSTCLGFLMCCWWWLEISSVVSIERTGIMCEIFTDISTKVLFAACRLATISWLLPFIHMIILIFPVMSGSSLH